MGDDCCELLLFELLLAPLLAGVVLVADADDAGILETGVVAAGTAGGTLSFEELLAVCAELVLLTVGVDDMYARARFFVQNIA